MIKFLLDENVPLSVLRLLRMKGYEAWRLRMPSVKLEESSLLVVVLGNFPYFVQQG